MQEEIAMIESAGRFLLQTGRENEFVVAGKGGMKPFARLGCSRLREFTLKVLFSSEELVAELPRDNTRGASGRRYTALWRNRFSDPVIDTHFCRLFSCQYPCVFESPLLLAWDATG
jgi:hypothetical protein